MIEPIPAARVEPPVYDFLGELLLADLLCSLDTFAFRFSSTRPPDQLDAT